MTKISKSIAFVAGLSMAFTLVAGVSANAQSMSLSDLIDALVKAGVISADKAVAAKAVASASTSSTFTKDLTVGSTGAEVSALQTKLGVSSTGYFGALTKAAVVAFQKENGLPSTGFVGPLTRAKLNAGSTVTTTTTTTTTGSTVVVNSGVEGTISATQTNSGVKSTVYEGDKQVSVLGFKLEAKNSDISVQRVKLDLGTETKIYNKIYDTVYVTSGDSVLAKAELNSNTVVKDGSRYYITLAGFNLIVPRNSEKTIYVKVDVKPSIDSTDLSNNYTIRLATDGVRGVDGAGIDQYTGSTAITRTINVDGDLADSASLKISTNTASPKVADVIASNGADNDELKDLALLSFDLKAEDDNVLVTDLAVDIVVGGSGTATTSNVYLYRANESTPIDSATVIGGVATFSDVDVTIAEDTTVTFTVKADIEGANGTVTTVSADIDTADVTAENSAGDSITETGSAAGETMYVRNAGILATLVGTPSISKSVTENNNYSTTSASVTFNVKIKAVGDAIYFGTQSASSTFTFGTFTNDTASVLAVASSTSFSVSEGGSVLKTGLASGQDFKLTEDAEVTVPVTFTFKNRLAATDALLDSVNTYKVGLTSIKWATEEAPHTVQTTNFMSGKTDWRSAPAL